MKIAIAQTKPFKGDISANIDKHKIFAKLVSALIATAIFFPELSITGYEPELVKDLATNQEDSRFDDFQKISDANKIAIGFGMPIKTQTGIQISMLFFQPNEQRQTYSKQQLHPDEFPYFVKGEKQTILTIADKKIAPAICYENLQTHHSENAVSLGAEIYLASVSKSQNGIEKAILHYSEVAKKFSIPFLMCNSVGYCGDFESVGKSSVWTKEGLLLAQLDGQNEGILLFDTETEEIIKRII